MALEENGRRAKTRYSSTVEDLGKGLPKKMKELHWHLPKIQNSAKISPVKDKWFRVSFHYECLYPNYRKFSVY